MGLLQGSRSQKLSLTGRGLLLTVLLGLAVLAIIAAPIRTPLTPKTQATPMMEQEANGDNEEETMVGDKTYRGKREDGGRCGAQTGDGGYILPGKPPSNGAGEEAVWWSTAANPSGIESISIGSDYKLLIDLTFESDGFIIESDDVLLDLNGHTITGDGQYWTKGVIVEGRTGVTIKNGTIKNFGCGIDLVNSNGTTLTGNTAIGNNGDGFVLDRSNGTTLTENNATANSGDGFDLDQSHDTTLAGNTATSNDDAGFHLYNSSGTTLTENTASGNDYAGFFLRGTITTLLTGNTATSNDDAGFLLEWPSSTTLTENTATSNTEDGFVLDRARNTTLTGNTATDNNANGFVLDRVRNTTLTRNTAIGNDISGFSLDSPSGTTLTGNTATGNDYGGFNLYGSSGTTLTGNTATSNSGAGFNLFESWDTTLTENTATGNDHGGFNLLWPSGNILTGNTATANRDGFRLEGYHNIEDKLRPTALTGNTVTGNTRYGVFMWDGASGNTLTGNTVTANGEYGIYLRNSNRNTIYNNYFDNDHNAHDEGTNRWNIAKTPGTNILGGAYLGGNFWSDYPGGDANADGLGDTPYAIPGDSNHDNRPLFDPTLVRAFPIPGGAISILLVTLILVIYPVRQGKRKMR